MFGVRLLSVLRGHSVFSSPPQRPMTSDFEAFSIPDCIHYIFVPILILEPVFPFSCWVPNKGTTGTIFNTYLVWRGPCRGIEPGSSRTRSQHFTTRLSKRRFKIIRRSTLFLLYWRRLLLFSAKSGILLFIEFCNLVVVFYIAKRV